MNPCCSAPALKRFTCEIGCPIANYQYCEQAARYCSNNRKSNPAQKCCDRQQSNDYLYFYTNPLARSIFEPSLQSRPLTDSPFPQSLGTVFTFIERERLPLFFVEKHWLNQKGIQ